MTLEMKSSIARPPIRRPRASAPKTSYTAIQLAKRYGFFAPPATQTQWVAVISLGGGFSQADINSYCNQYSLPNPPVQFVSVQGATNDYTGNPNSADGENALDIQNIIGATGGKVGIKVYTAPNTDNGFSAAIAQVAMDNVCCVCTISWGSAEPNWTATALAKMNAAIQACLANKIPVFAASGDDGSSDGTNGNAVDFPASSPYVVGCGGTTLTPTSEIAWTSGGGGVSGNFARPSFQASVAAALGSGRLVPDLALDADPNSGYPIVLNNAWDTFGGTSAVGPMMVAGIALIVSATGKRVEPSLLFSTIYGSTLLDITKGANTSIQGAIAPKFNAGIGFDLCTGNGVPTTAFWSALAGPVTTPPPPPISPPPVSPPPVSPPPTVPPPVTPPNQTLRQEIDKIFTYLENKYARNPTVLWALKLTYTLIQNYLNTAGLFVANAAATPQQILDTILDAVAAMLDNPWEKMAVEVVKALVDAYFDSVA